MESAVRAAYSFWPALIPPDPGRAVAAAAIASRLCAHDGGLRRTVAPIRAGRGDIRSHLVGLEVSTTSRELVSL